MDYTISDIKGFDPTICMHHTLMEGNTKPFIERRRRVNPNSYETVLKEVENLLDAVIIYLISDSEWVSPVQVVMKKAVYNRQKWREPPYHIANDNWIEDLHQYQTLNKCTRKDHFPLPFVDQMFEHLAKHSFFYFLDVYFGFCKYQFVWKIKRRPYPHSPTELSLIERCPSGHATPQGPQRRSNGVWQQSSSISLKK